MNTTLKKAWEFILGWAVIGGIAWLVWWLTDGAVHRARFWWSIATLFFFLPMGAYAGFFVWMIISWKRHIDREKRKALRGPDHE